MPDRSSLPEIWDDQMLTRADQIHSEHAEELDRLEAKYWEKYEWLAYQYLMALFYGHSEVFVPTSLTNDSA